MESDEDVYKASPQVSGSNAHSTIDNRHASTRKEDIMSIPVYSEELGINGVIDIFKGQEHLLIERKNNLKQIFRGQVYQLWAQYFCLVEMGYHIEKKLLSTRFPPTKCSTSPYPLIGTKRS